MTAELYLVLNKVSEAEACVVETSSMFPLSHQVYFMVSHRVLSCHFNYLLIDKCFVGFYSCIHVYFG